MGIRSRRPLFFVAFFLFVCVLGIHTEVARGQSAPASNSGGGSTDAYRAKLQAQLQDLEKQIAGQQGILDQAKGQEVSLSRDIKILDAQIAQAQLSIKARNIAIEELSSDIHDKQTTIVGLSGQMDKELESLAAILREKDQLDTTPLMVVALSSKNLSDFFSDLDAFDQINTKLQDSFVKILDIKTKTQQQQSDLQSQRDQESQLLEVQQLQKKQIQDQQNNKNKILAQTKGQEKAYQTILAQTQKSATQIRAALFQLTGASAIPFGTALDYANKASKQTGIRPAFLLGLIREESNLGQNVGKGTWSVDMKAPRDTVPFGAITASLGLDPNAMPVSKRQSYGWGGAMGPAQFIPSTWAGYAGYVAPDYHYDASKDRVGQLTGNKPPNPWNPDDAFMAAAIYLTDNGADAQTTSAEFRAAMCYLAGCGGVNNKNLQFYGQDVATYAAQFQCQIDIINGKQSSASCG